jgi:L-gulonate 5-dehydrogenase
MHIEEVDAPAVSAGQARIDVSVVGLCGSDYHLFSGEHPYASYPQTQGHEFAGTVLELAPDYTGPVKVGDVVAVEPLVADGTCFACRHGHYNACANLKVMGAHIPGALADQVVVATSALYPVGDLDIELAALVEPVSVGLQAVVRGRVSTGDTVVILGAGPIGLAATLAASARGARVLVADLLPERLESARVMGASEVVDTSKSDLAEAVQAFTAQDGAAVVIDATGVPALIRLAFDIIAPSGAIVLVGISDREVSIPVIEFTRKEVNVYGSRNNTSLFGEAVELVRSHQNQLRTWITHRITLEEVPTMIEFAINHPESVEKMLVHMKEN